MAIVKNYDLVKTAYCKHKAMTKILNDQLATLF